jgi:hypothetical protein
MSQHRLRRIGTMAAVVALAGIFSYAQEKPAEHPAAPSPHDHAAMQAQGAKSAVSTDTSHEDEVAIFCPTMKTGQLCSHGTMNILQLKGDKADQWLTMARKYNQAVDAATLQLFKDAEGTLTPQQLDLLKAWFAVGLNPEINDLLYSKGLGPKK